MSRPEDPGPTPLRCTPLGDDHFHDECGLFGVFGHPDAAHLSYMGLYALQHRGQESAGIAAGDGESLRVEKGMGLVNDVFTESRLRALPGDRAIGHVRYSTSGDTVASNAQPYLIECHRGPIAVGHNGNLVNAAILRQELEAAGSIFQSTSDTEVILHLYARSHRERLEDAIAASLYKVMGAFSLVFLTREALVAARDPWGFRPLVLGRLNGATIVASETCALDLIAAEYLRDVEPGELIVADADGVRSFKPFPPEPAAHCVFEHVYFARPDSRVFGRSVLESRLSLGRQLAIESPADADVVVPIPDSGMGAALGFARQSGLPFEWGLIRNHYVGRTFIQPRQAERSLGVKIKLNPVREVIEGRRVVLIDDSIVRGTTSRKIVHMVREAGAREVHIRISSPPTTGPCYYGIDTPLRSELIASSHSVEEIRRFVGADSLAYLSHEGLLKAVGDESGRRHCTACFSGRYPVAVIVPDEAQLRLFEKARA
ncbi:MAG TPA: amidophosphoribosyltransferase [Vicinamibacteria bacterium]|nr:amidophosphoribosyltransferase [Vicinamibacteria bacterium]